MKRLFLILIVSIFFLTGCSKEKYFTCKIDLYNEVQEYQFIAEYKVYYKKSYVTRIEKEEVYTSENEDTLDYFNEYKNLEYMNLNNLYGGITHTVEFKGNKVMLNANIDVSLMDIKKMIKNKYIDRDYVVSNKLTTGGIKKIYEEKGAICDI